jgi:hypothetical protein
MVLPLPGNDRITRDTYLLDPHLPALSVTVGGGRALDV